MDFSNGSIRVFPKINRVYSKYFIKTIWVEYNLVKVTQMDFHFTAVDVFFIFFPGYGDHRFGKINSLYQSF